MPPKCFLAALFNLTCVGSPPEASKDLEPRLEGLDLPQWDFGGSWRTCEVVEDLGGSFRWTDGIVPQKLSKAWNLLEDLGGSQRIWEGLGGSWRILEGPGAVWKILKDLGGVRRIREDLGGSWRALENPGGPWRILKDLGGSWRLEGSSRICEDFRGSWRILDNLGGSGWLAPWGEFRSPWPGISFRRPGSRESLSVEA